MTNGGGHPSAEPKKPDETQDQNPDTKASDEAQTTD